eukprot:s647_g21.t2
MAELQSREMEFQQTKGELETLYMRKENEEEINGNPQLKEIFEATVLKVDGLTTAYAGTVKSVVFLGQVVRSHQFPPGFRSAGVAAVTGQETFSPRELNCAFMLSRRSPAASEWAQRENDFPCIFVSINSSFVLLAPLALSTAPCPCSPKRSRMQRIMVDGRNPAPVMHFPSLQPTFRERLSRAAERAAERVSSLRFSSCGRYLAAGSWDQEVYLLHIDSESRVTLQRILSGNSSSIVSVMFSEDSRYVMSNSKDCQILHWSTKDGTLQRSQSVFRDTRWQAPWTSVLGWPVVGIWSDPKYDASDINSACQAYAPHHDLLAFGDDYGCVKLLRFPSPFLNPGIEAYKPFAPRASLKILQEMAVQFTLPINSQLGVISFCSNLASCPGASQDALCMSSLFLLEKLDMLQLPSDDVPASKLRCLPGWLRGSELLRYWKQVLAAWIVFFVTAGMTYQAPPIMLDAIRRDFEVDHYRIAYLGAIFQLCKGIFTMPGGFALHHYGCRSCFRAGALIILISSILYPLAPSLWTWFEGETALAISILVTAFSFSGICFPPMVAYFIAHHGWRRASLMCPILTALVVIPICFCLLQDGPLRQRAQRAAQRVPDSEEGQAQPLVHLNFWRSLRLGAVWHLAFLSLYQLYIIIALINTLTLYLKDTV